MVLPESQTFSCLSLPAPTPPLFLLLLFLPAPQQRPALLNSPRVSLPPLSPLNPGCKRASCRAGGARVTRVTHSPDHTAPGSHTQCCLLPMPQPFPMELKTHPNQTPSLRAAVPGWEGEGWQNRRPAILLLAWDAVPETIAPLSCRRWSEGQLLHRRGEGYNPQQENHIFHSNLLHPLPPTAADPVLIPGRRAKAPGMWCAQRLGQRKPSRLRAPQLGG